MVTRDRSSKVGVKPDEIHLSDWKRILLGEAPWSFLLEVLIRATVTYLALLIVVRLLGKRMASQATILEMGVMITVGGIVSVPMQTPDRGILLGFVLLVAILALHRGIGRLGVTSRRMELLTQGDVTMLVKDGAFVLDELRDVALSRQQVFAALRAEGVQQLGAVKRVYLEACGDFTVLLADEPKPGLTVLPRKDVPIVAARRVADGVRACGSCGATSNGTGACDRPCERCGAREWREAVT